MKKIISFTGSPGTGKSTAAAICYEGQKIANPNRSVGILVDLERQCPFPINQKTTEAALSWLFHNQAIHEINALEQFDVLVTDRTLLDIVAYTQVAGMTALAQGMLAYAEWRLHHYSTIIFKTTRTNSHCHPDGFRDASDARLRQAVEATLLDLYRQAVRVGVLDPGVLHHE